MQTSILLAMLSFSFAMSITPGPVNMIVLSSGVNYGVRKTLPYALGATIGFTLLLLAVGLGFYQVIKTYPFFLKYLGIAGSLYIMYMGYQCASSNPTELDVKKEKIPKFYDGFLLQWLNPKAWVACVSGVPLFSSAISCLPFLTFTTIYFLVCFACLVIWALVGAKLANLLNSYFRLRLFDISMGLLLILTAAYLCFQLILS